MSVSYEHSQFVADMITLSTTEEFLAHTPMVIGRSRARLASGGAEQDALLTSLANAVYAAGGN